MKSYFRITIILLTLAVNYAQSQTTFTENELKKISKSFRQFIPKKMKKEEVVGLNVAISIHGKTILNEGFGFSDAANNTKTTKDTKYPIGSVSKIVTSTAVLKLYSDGLIDIDKPYVNYVKDFSIKSKNNDDKKITVRHLLSHYGGLPRVIAKGFLTKKDKSLETLIERVKNEHMVSTPGTAYQYSDLGVDLLALLVERVSKVKFGEYLQKNVFEALNLEHSYVGKLTSGKGYVRGKEQPTYEYSYPGSDGVVSSASDLSKLTQLYMQEGNMNGNQFLKPNIAKEAVKRQFLDAPLSFDTEVGYMWDVRDLRVGYTRVKKAGIHEPYYSYIFFIPELKTSLVVCSNSNSSSSIHWEIWSKLYNTLSKKYRFANYQGPHKKRKNAKKVILTDKQLDKISGTYSTNDGLFTFKRNGEKFNVIAHSENVKGIGIPYSEGLIKLYVKKLGIKVKAMDIFWTEYDGKIVVGEQFKSGSRKIFGAKIPKSEIPEVWKKAVGTYKVVNYNDDDYRTFNEIKLFINSEGYLEINGGVNYPREMSIQLGLSPISDNKAIVPGYNFDFFGGETIVLNKEDDTFILKLSGYKFQKIK